MIFEDLTMCRSVENMRNEAVYAERIRIVLAMLKEQMSCEVIAKLSGLSLEEVHKLAAQAGV